MDNYLITYKDKLLHIFDYDYTLYILELDDKYKNYVSDKILELYNMGKRIAMASHNMCAENNVRKKYSNIYHCFSKFICDYPRPKDSMVLEILNHFDCDPSDAIFYDDLRKNVELVRELGVTTYLVNESRGIEFEDIIFDGKTDDVYDQIYGHRHMNCEDYKNFKENFVQRLGERLDTNKQSSTTDTTDTNTEEHNTKEANIDTKGQ